VVDLKFLFFHFAISQNGCMPLGGMKMEPVRWAGGQDVPGVDVRKLVWMAWMAWIPYNFVSYVGNNS
jgi:hypothetical protein